jgi:hypothetical protein
VLTYALRALLDAGVMDHLAFKGGTCLRNVVFGSAGRFSEDLDFTLDTDRADDDVLTEIVEVFNREHYGIAFRFEEDYKTEDHTSFGGDAIYTHSWNDAGRFDCRCVCESDRRCRRGIPAGPVRWTEATRSDFHDFHEYESLVEAAKAAGSDEHLVVLLGGDAGLRCARCSRSNGRTLTSPSACFM